MKNWFAALLSFGLLSTGLIADDGVTAFKRSGDDLAKVSEFFDARYKPFYHGVASGDPLSDRVILWTRVTPEQDGPVKVQWRIATDVDLENVVNSGEVETSMDRDYTVKVDATGLQANTTYYYGFSALGANSLTGRTKTAPTAKVDRLRFGIVSCSNFQQGFFNAYARLADRNDLDVIVHLGDYIYEYEEGGYGYNETAKRGHEPKSEIVTLEDYRVRYSFYRLDEDLRRVHQQHPFIVVYDDHETTNDSYKDGAENHTPGEEGDWNTRKNNALQAYFEWLPIREQSAGSRRTYRTISYGGLADLIMIDTRLEGREKQLLPKGGTGEIDTAEWFNPNRTMMGVEQRNWFLQQVTQSQAQWKVVGNQTMMMQVGGFLNLDAWDGYPAEREIIFGALAQNNVNNLVVVTGDIHSTWAGELTSNPWDPNVYNAETAMGVVGVEFVTPSISSANLNEINDAPPRNPVSIGTENALLGGNPHMRLCELDSHGYFLLDLTSEAAQADWWYIDELLEPSDDEHFAAAWSVNAGASQLQSQSTPRPDRANAPIPAPSDPPVSTGLEDQPTVNNSGVVIMSHYPNPSTSETTLHYMLARGGEVEIDLFNIRGELVKQLLRTTQEAGAYTFNFSTAEYGSGFYRCEIRTATGSAGRTINIIR